jgi:hypothetical protein
MVGTFLTPSLETLLLMHPSNGFSGLISSSISNLQVLIFQEFFYLNHKDTYLSVPTHK